MNLRRLLIAAATLASAHLSATLVTPEVLTWTNPPSGDWLASSIWTDGTTTYTWVNDGSHDAVFGPTGGIVNSTGAINVRNILVQQDGATAYVLSGSYTVNYTGYFLADYGVATVGNGVNLTGGANIFVGTEFSNATLNLYGAMSAVSASIGTGAASSGNLLEVAIDGDTASLTLSGDLNVGFEGAGNTLRINQNGTVSANYVKVGGYASSTENTVEVNSGGSLQVTNTLTLGYAGGANALNINAGGTVTNVDAVVGLNTGASANIVKVDGASALWNITGTFYFGEASADNELTVSNGGWVKVEGASKDVVIGDLATSTGNTVVIKDAGSKLSNLATFYVGKAGSDNSVTVQGGATLSTKNTRISGSAGSSGNSLTITGTGTTWTNSGTLRVGSLGGGATLTVSAGAQATVTGNTFVGYGTGTAGNKILVTGTGSSLTVGTLTIGQAGSVYNSVTVKDGATLTSNGTITLGGANAMLRIGEYGAPGTVNATTITASGTGDDTGHVVQFDHNSSDYTFSANLSGDLGVVHGGSGTTTLTGTLTYTGGTTVSAGTLRMNTSYTGVTTVQAGSVLGGSGSFTGAINVYGKLAPGNSPGVTTQVSGDTTMFTGSTFSVELDGTTPGNGNGFHDQHIVSAGQFIIQSGVTLEVKDWTTFVPARGNVFTIINASNGITGSFADMTNLDFSTLVVYDNTTAPHTLGKLYGTGLTGTQTLAAYATNASQVAIGDALTAAALTYTTSSTALHPAAFVDSSTVAGQAAIAVIMGAPLSGFSPEDYFGMSDYVYTVTRSALDVALSQGPQVKAGRWSASFGYARAENRNVPANRELTGDTGVFAVNYDASQTAQLGFFVGRNDGDTRASTTRIDYQGENFGLFVRGNSNLGKLPFEYKATVFGGLYSFDSVRQTSVLTPVLGGGFTLTPATAGASGVDSTIYGGELLLFSELLKKGDFSLRPYLGAVFARTSTDAFTEAGGMSVGKSNSDSTRTLVGLSADYRMDASLSFSLSFGWEHEYSDVSTTLNADLGGLPLTVTSPETRRDTTVTGLRAVYGFKDGAALSAGVEFRTNADYRADRRLFVSFGRSF